MTYSTPTLRTSRDAALQGWESLLSGLGKGKDAGSLASSGLSMALRYRLLSESEALTSLLSRHKPQLADALLKELAATTYWRGWAEGRPQIYLTYVRACDDDRRRFTGTQSLATALEGRTGLVAFDEWNKEMVETGWLPQQARLWYASIWIFTLRLPWTLGAAHFASHLIDTDAATSVLMWRSVAGLHTSPKPYVAKAAEISKWSQGRYDLTGHLNESPVALTGPALPSPRFQELPAQPSGALAENYALLVTPDDLSPETSSIGELKPRVILTTGFENLSKNVQFGPKVRGFVNSALEDTADRLARHYDCPVESLAHSDNVGETIGERLTSQNIPHLVYHQPSLGPWQEMLSRATSKDVGLKYFPLRRGWDSKLWPSATRALLDFHEAVKPRLLKSQGRL